MGNVWVREVGSAIEPTMVEMLLTEFPAFIAEFMSSFRHVRNVDKGWIPCK